MTAALQLVQSHIESAKTEIGLYLESQFQRTARTEDNPNLCKTRKSQQTDPAVGHSKGATAYRVLVEDL